MTGVNCFLVVVFIVLDLFLMIMNEQAEHVYDIITAGFLNAINSGFNVILRVDLNQLHHQ